MARYEDIEPFKDGKKMKEFENELLKHGARPTEIYVEWQIGKICLLRVSDVLKLKVGQIYKSNGKVYNQIVTHDKKTKKYNPLVLIPLKRLLGNYRNWRIAHKIHSAWMFPSATNSSKPMSRVVVYRRLKRTADFLGFKHIGCHSARKTGAYIYYKTHNDLAQTSRILNHSSQKITERYLGITDPAIEHNIVHTDWGNIPK